MYSTFYSKHIVVHLRIVNKCNYVYSFIIKSVICIECYLITVIMFIVIMFIVNITQHLIVYRCYSVTSFKCTANYHLAEYTIKAGQRNV